MTHARADMNMTGRAALFARPVKVTQPVRFGSSLPAGVHRNCESFLLGNAANLQVVDRPPPVVAGIEQAKRNDQTWGPRGILQIDGNSLIG